MSNNQDSPKNQITICLEESKYAHEFDSKENVHANNFERVMNIVKKQVSKLDCSNTDSFFSVEHQYNTISIFGGRGTGKTTFILSILRDIEQKYKDEAQILNIIDPTQMEEKEHVFLVILTLIDTEVRKKIEELKKNSNNACCCYEKEWNNKLSSLAKGLPTLEGLNKKQYENWDDNWYIVESGIDNVRSAYNLEKNFHDLVDKALKIIGKKFFVLAFDDTDVDFSKGWHVLETIRKYLTSSKFVIFLSGDLTLYSYNIRLHQWKQFKELKDFKEHDYKSQVNQLEGQYLLKVLKPENRIQLRSLLDYERTYNTSYIIKEKDKEIKDVYSDFLESLGIHKNSTQQLFIDYLLGLSIRSQISILSDNEESDIMRQINVYVLYMMAAGIDVDLAVKNPVFTLISIVGYLAKSNLFPHSYLLIPNTEKHDDDGVLMGLTTMFANQVKQNPWIIFDYMLRVGYARQLNMQLDADAFKQMLEYSGIMQDMSIKNIVILMTAVGKAKKLNLPELVPLEGLAIKGKQKKEDKENAIDSILQNDRIDMAQKVVALLPLFSLKRGQTQKSDLYYSVLPLLSAICMILRFGNDKLSIKGLLSDLSLHRTYPMPSEEQIVSETAESNIVLNKELSQKLDINIEDGDLNKSITDLSEWRTYFLKGVESIPPYLLGRIMTRFTSAVTNVSKKKNLAELYQQHLIVFLNSVLVEEAKEKFGKSVNVNNNNPTESFTLFIDNLKKVTKKIDNNSNKKYWDSLCLTYRILICPLIFEFISKDILNEIEKYVESFPITCETNLSSGKKKLTLYEVLSDITIKVKEKVTDDKINITMDNLEESLERIIEEKGISFFKKYIYETDNRKSLRRIKKQSFVDTVGRGCTKKLKELFKKKYLANSDTTSSKLKHEK